MLKERNETQEFQRSDISLCPLSFLGREAVWHSVLENCTTDILTFFILVKVFVFWKCHVLTDLHCETFVITQSPRTMSALFDWTQCSESLSFRDTVETHNTWECAPATERRGSAVDGKLDLNDHRWKNWLIQNPYRAKTFSSSGFFHRWQNIGTFNKWFAMKLCFTSCFLWYFSRNNDIQGWTLPLGKVGNYLVPN